MRSSTHISWAGHLGAIGLTCAVVWACMLPADAWSAGSPRWRRAVKGPPDFQRGRLVQALMTGRERLFFADSFDHELGAKNVADSRSQFIIKPDRGGGYPLAVALFKGVDTPQAPEAAQVDPAAAGHFGRMVRRLLETTVRDAQKGGRDTTGVIGFANMPGVMPVLHVHGLANEANRVRVSDWDALLREHRYQQVRADIAPATAEVFALYRSDRTSAPWKVLAIADAELGTPAEMSLKTDALLGAMSIAAAREGVEAHAHGLTVPRDASRLIVLAK